MVMRPVTPKPSRSLVAFYGLCSYLPGILCMRCCLPELLGRGCMLCMLFWEMCHGPSGPPHNLCTYRRNQMQRTVQLSRCRILWLGLCPRHSAPLDTGDKENSPMQRQFQADILHRKDRVSYLCYVFDVPETEKQAHCTLEPRRAQARAHLLEPHVSAPSSISEQFNPCPYRLVRHIMKACLTS